MRASGRTYRKYLELLLYASNNDNGNSIHISNSSSVARCACDAVYEYAPNGTVATGLELTLPNKHRIIFATPKANLVGRYAHSVFKDHFVEEKEAA